MISLKKTDIKQELSYKGSVRGGDTYELFFKDNSQGLKTLEAAGQMSEKSRMLLRSLSLFPG